MNRILRRVLLAASVCLNLAVLGAFVAGRVSGGGPGMHGLSEGPISTALADRLELDADARARLETLRAPLLASRLTLADEAATTRAEMVDAIVAGDETRAEAARLHLVERQLGFQQKVVAYLASVAQTLDAAQRERMRDFLQTSLFPGLGGAPKESRK